MRLSAKHAMLHAEKQELQVHKAPRLSLLVKKQSSTQKRHIFIMVAPPAGGKGTQSAKISTAMNIPHLSTGDMLRGEVAKGTDIGKQAEEAMARGDLVSDELVIKIVQSRISEEDCEDGFILDGFPRTTPQAEALDAMLEESGEQVSKIFNLKVPDDVVVQRITGRWIHKPSGRSYHVLWNPPKSLGDKEASPETMLDDVTGEPLTQRADDTKEAAVARIAKYYSETEPILEHYSKKGGNIATINGDQGIDEVAADIAAELPSTSPASPDLSIDVNDCSRVKGAVWRNSWWRRSVECKCPDSTVVTGESDVCKAKAANFDRYFDVDSDVGKDGTCKCGRPSDPTGVNTRPHYDCALETTVDKAKFPKYPDLLETAHSWCNSDLVPEEIRVPKFLRGLYWMKGLALDDIAFCPGIAEWDAETLTARMPVWSSFVVGRQSWEEVPQLILDTSGRGKPWTLHGFGIGENVLIYSIKFSNNTFTQATITPNAPIFRTLGFHDMTEMDQTKDGKITSQKKGDIFERKTWMAGIQTKGYEAVRVMDDDGVIDQHIAAMMRETETKLNITYMRYAPSC